MNKSQNNYLRMAQSAILTLRAHEESWEGKPIVADSVEKANTIIGGIENEATKQIQNKTSGLTAEKNKKEDEFEECIFVIGGRIAIFAERTGNNLLAEQVRFTRSDLSNMVMNELLATGQAVIKAAEKYTTELEPYSVGQPEIDLLRQTAETASQLYAQCKATQSEHSENTAHLIGLFKQLRAELKVMDKIIESYVTDEELLGAYFFSRRIHDVRGAVSRKAPSATTQPAEQEKPCTCPAQGGTAAGQEGGQPEL